jgi:hypothetical protein
MNLTSLSAKQLRRAADIKEKIATLQSELEEYLGVVVSSVSNFLAPAKRKSRMSAAGRARIIAAQKARWAKVKAGKPAGKAAGKRKMSAAARAKIAAAARARWAKAKASGKKAL